MRGFRAAILLALCALLIQGASLALPALCTPPAALAELGRPLAANARLGWRQAGPRGSGRRLTLVRVSAAAHHHHKVATTLTAVPCRHCRHAVAQHAGACWCWCRRHCRRRRHRRCRRLRPGAVLNGRAGWSEVWAKQSKASPALGSCAVQHHAQCITLLAATAPIHPRSPRPLAFPARAGGCQRCGGCVCRRGCFGPGLLRRGRLPGPHLVLLLAPGKRWLFLGRRGWAEQTGQARSRGTFAGRLPTAQLAASLRQAANRLARAPSCPPSAALADLAGLVQQAEGPRGPRPSSEGAYRGPVASPLPSRGARQRRSVPCPSRCAHRCSLDCWRDRRLYHRSHHCGHRWCCCRGRCGRGESRWLGLWTAVAGLLAAGWVPTAACLP